MTNNIVHIRNKDLQISTFTGANNILTTEAGINITTEALVDIELDGVVSWTIQIIHAQPKIDLIHAKTGEQFVTTVGLQFTLVNQNGDTLVNQNGDTLVATIVGSWPTPLVHV